MTTGMKSFPESCLLFLISVSFIVMFSPTPALAADTTSENLWIADEKKDFEEKLADLRAKETLARGVLEQAQHAEAKAIQLDDNEALSISQKAVDLAQQALAKARQRVIKQTSGIDALNKAIHLSGVDGIAIEAQGPVLKKQGNKWIPLKNAGSLQPGETIRTGRTGSAEIIFRDGSHVTLGPASDFTLSDKSENESVYEFIKGLLHNRIRYPPAGGLRGQLIQFQMPIAIAGVRGTEFDLRVDELGLTHLVPYTGTVELSTRPKKIMSLKNRWWKTVLSKTNHDPFPKNILFRIVSLQGDGVILGTDNKPRLGVIGEALVSGETFETKHNTMAQIELAGGHLGVIDSNTRIETRQDDAAGKITFTIKQGRAYLKKKEFGAEEALPDLIAATPNAEVKGKGSEFEVSVDPNGIADVVPLGGMVEVKAQSGQLNLEKIKPWWIEP